VPFTLAFTTGQVKVSDDSAVSFVFSSLCGNGKLLESQKRSFLR
jgi:hypothetical protein